MPRNPDPHPFARATLQRAVRAWLKDRHQHDTPQAMSECAPCVARLWDELGRVAPKGWLGEV